MWLLGLMYHMWSKCCVRLEHIFKSKIVDNSRGLDIA